MPPGVLTEPRAICTTSRTVVFASPCRFQNASAASISSRLMCTHWPRSLTSGAFSFARASSSWRDSFSSPSVTSQSTRTSVSSVNVLPACIADGAPWIWNLVAEHFPERVEILDFYHAAERLHAVGKAAYGEDSAEARRFAETNQQRLLAGRADEVLRSLRALRPARAEAREVVRKAIDYFQHNRARLRYDEFRARGYHIGSGVVEAACKHVVGSRCKRSGMRWTKPGAQSILSLRCLLLNDRWEDYWKPRGCANTVKHLRRHPYFVLQPEAFAPGNSEVLFEGSASKPLEGTTASACPPT